MAPDDGQTVSDAGPTEDRGLPVPWRFSWVAALSLAFIAGLSAGYLFWGDRSAPATVGRPEAATQEVTRLEVSADDDPALGPPDAPVTLIEFSDFQCPYCTKFHQETFRPLMQAYEGRLRFVYRDFPVLGPESVTAAMAASCAGEQGRYWEFHDRLFSGTYELGRMAYRRYAEELGLNSEALLNCLDSERFREEVLADARDAAALGVNGTPTFFINGRPLVGAQPLSSFARLIDQELER